VIVSLPEQMAYVYRNGVLIGRSTVSTGKPGHETPTGVFTILQKRVDHESNIYKGAQMPYMQRLTWDGIALHAGQLPGYPASHGCVRLPLSFSEKLFATTSMGTTVIVTDNHSSPVETVHPALLSPVSADSGALVRASQVSGGDFVWQGEAAPQGPVTLLLSTADRMVYVYGNGVKIGNAAIELRDPGEPLGAGVYTMLAGYADYESAYVPGQRGRRWMAVDLPARTGELLKSEIMERVKVPPEFARRVYDIIQPGTTLMVTDLPATEQTTTGTDFVVMSTPAAAPDEGG
jgi:hypothetical protein